VCGQPKKWHTDNRDGGPHGYSNTDKHGFNITGVRFYFNEAGSLIRTPLRCNPCHLYAKVGHKT
jgi:hypothetical protein